MTNRFPTADAVVSALRPSEPLLLSRPHEARRAAAEVMHSFPGAVAYAVKVCDRPEVIHALADGGIHRWDVASIHEIRSMQALLPQAHLHYMNPIKSREHIAEAYGRGVRTFAFDCARELAKIAEHTGGDRRVMPVVRVAVPNDKAVLPIDGKFGCDEAEAVRLLSLAASSGYRPGVTFHVGSQCHDARAYATATKIVCRAAAAAGIDPAMVDIGGGFPAAYRGDEPSFADCTQAAKRALDRWLPNFRGEFQCEPGRVLAARSASVLVRVELRKGHALYLNEGYYGPLAELKWMPGLHPVRMIRPEGASQAPLQPFGFFGPTCDSVDTMEGPYLLPGDIDEGDWIEISLVGAYSTALATRFNGFPELRSVTIDDTLAVRKAA
jgi:ornithine decarboxylase